MRLANALSVLGLLVFAAVAGAQSLVPSTNDGDWQLTGTGVLSGDAAVWDKVRLAYPDKLTVANGIAVDLWVLFGNSLLTELAIIDITSWNPTTFTFGLQRNSLIDVNAFKAKLQGDGLSTQWLNVTSVTYWQAEVGLLTPAPATDAPAAENAARNQAPTLAPSFWTGPQYNVRMTSVTFSDGSGATGTPGTPAPQGPSPQVTLPPGFTLPVSLPPGFTLPSFLTNNSLAEALGNGCGSVAVMAAAVGGVAMAVAAL